MHILRIVVASVIVSLAADICRAAENGFYLGAAVGTTTVPERAGLGAIYDDEDSGFKILGGWRPFDWFAVEGSYYDLGDVALRQFAPDLSPFRLQQTAYAGYGTFLFEIANFDLFAKAGIVRSSADYTSNTIIGPLRWNDRDTDIAWGFGGQVRFGQIAARLEYERFEISNGDLFRRPRLISFGMTWMFSGD